MRRVTIGVFAGVFAVGLVSGCKDKDKDKGGAANQSASATGTPATAQAARGAPAASGPAAGELGVESARITFKYSGLEEGTVTAWVGERGAVVALAYDLTRPTTEKRNMLWKDGRTKMWGPGKKPSTSRMRARDAELRLVSTTDPAQLTAAGYAKQPNETIAGQDCEVWRAEKTNVTLWRWKGIDLKYTNGAGGAQIAQAVEATEVVTPAELPPEMLGPPD